MPEGEHYDAVVVGSGFGGSVTALRFAEAGLSVCLLERGKRYGPGDFPTSPRLMARNFWDPSAGLQGLFDVWAFRHLEAVVSAGLGGGSLIYANVLLRKDERWFVHESPFPGGYENWPISRADLDPHYDTVERMLGANPLPLGAGYPDVPKARALLEAAARAGLDCRRPNLAVSFAAPGRAPEVGAPIPEAPYGNVHGRPRSTCRLCGECDTGCNAGAKNTLDHTYLSAAAHCGAELRTRCEVRTIAPRPEGGFTVGYVVHLDENEGRPVKTDRLPVVTITADRLVLGAGSLGTSYLLLRNKANFPHLGAALGTRFSGNGDLIGFVMEATDGSGRRREDRDLFASRGPVITSAVRVADAVDGAPSGGRGYYVEDAGYPAFVDWLAEATSVPNTAKRFLRFGWERLRTKVARDPRSRMGVELAALIGSGRISGCSMPLLAMGRDIPDGRLGLWGNWLDVSWNMTSSEEYFGAVTATMAELAEALGGRFHPNPMGRFKRCITAHPVGGVPMGRHIGEGVVDAWGESFTYPGLYVVDGAAMPGPVGANPSLTIAAFAERAAQRAIEQRRRPAARRVTVDVRESEPAAALDLTAAAGPPPAPQAQAQAPDPQAGRLAFTEEMHGHVTLGEADPATGAAHHGRTGCAFHLTIEIADIDRFLDDPDLAATAAGWVECEALGGVLPVLGGTFNLFVEQGDGSDRMRYRLKFKDGNGVPLTLSGFKVVRDDPGFDVWSDTTTLYVRILAGHVEPADEAAAEVVGAGVLRIGPAGLVRLLRSMETGGPHPLRTRARFMERFASTLWDLYAPAVEHQEV